MKTWHVSLSAVGLGVWIGILTGLSASPVVASVLAIVAPIATAFLAWVTAKKSANAPVDAMRGYIAAVGCFAWSAALATIVAVTARTHQWLSPSLTTVSARWQEAGFSADAARKIAAMQMLGVGLPAADEKGKDEKAENEAPHVMPSVISSVLFSDRVGGANLAQVRPLVAQAPMKEVYHALREQGEPWTRVAAYLQRSELSEREQRAFVGQLIDAMEAAPSP